MDVFLENIDELLKIKDEINSVEDKAYIKSSYVVRKLDLKDN